MGGRTGAFDVDGSQAQSLEERFDATHVNIGYGDISLKWHQNWEPVLGTSLIKTLMAGGVRYNFNHSMDVGANIAGIWGSDSVDLPRTYQYFNTSLILEFNKNTLVMSASMTRPVIHITPRRSLPTRFNCARLFRPYTMILSG